MQLPVVSRDCPLSSSETVPYIIHASRKSRFERYTSRRRKEPTISPSLNRPIVFNDRYSVTSGEGRRDALRGIAGGAGMFAEIYPFLKTAVLKRGDYGSITLPHVLEFQHWTVIVPFVVGGMDSPFRVVRKEGTLKPEA